MGVAQQTEKYSVEQRVFLGTDKRSDRSLIEQTFFSDSENLTLDQGVVKTRPGSVRWGTISFAAVVGNTNGFATIDVGAVYYAIAHIGERIYYGLKTDATPDIMALEDSSELEVEDEESEFMPFGMEFDSSGNRILKVLFKQASGCKVLEFNQGTNAWVGRAPSISMDTLTSLAPAISGRNFQNEGGTYRMRLVAARIINGVRVLESPAWATDNANIGRSFAEITAEETHGLWVFITGTAAPVGATHWIVQVTRPLNLVGDSSFSDNGNDPTIFFETPPIAIDGNFASMGFQAFEIDATQLTIPCLDTMFWQPIPGHLISAFAGGVLFFGGIATKQSRIYRAGGDGLMYHNEMYNPADFHPADESDGKDLTGLAIVGDHLGVWKENKTGIVVNREAGTSVVWRDRKIGVSHRRGLGIIAEDEILVLCHDGRLRIFNGVSYSSRKLVGESEMDLSNKMVSVTESIDASTVNFLWHRSKLHMIYGEPGERRALVLHPEDGYGWMPWADLDHQFNGFVDNENSWIFLSVDDGLLYEQSPKSVETYLDRGSDFVDWFLWFAPVHAKNRKGKIWMTQWLVEAYFQYIFTGYFKMDGGRIVTASASGVPDPELSAFSYFQWFHLAAEQAVMGHFYETYLAGSGKAIIRATNAEIIERIMMVPGWTVSSNYNSYDLSPPWIGPAILHLTLDEDSDTAQDSSGNNRDHVYSAGEGGSRTYEDSMAPGGGQSLVGEVSSGYSCPTWNGMSYIGDDDGYNSVPLTFEYVFEFPDLSSNQVLHHATDGVSYWTIRALVDGSLDFTLHTVGENSISRRFFTDPGVVEEGEDAYTIQFVLTNGGLNGQFYVAPRTGPYELIITDSEDL